MFHFFVALSCKNANDKIGARDVQLGASGMTTECNLKLLLLIAAFQNLMNIVSNSYTSRFHQSHVYTHMRPSHSFNFLYWSITENRFDQLSQKQQKFLSHFNLADVFLYWLHATWKFATCDETHLRFQGLVRLRFGMSSSSLRIDVDQSAPEAKERSSQLKVHGTFGHQDNFWFACRMKKRYSCSG